MPPDDKIPGSGSGVGVGVGSSPAADNYSAPQSEPDNYWPEEFDDSGNVVKKTDATLFSDDSKKQTPDRQSLINKAKTNIQKGRQLAKDLREFDTPENRERAKKIAEQKARKIARNQLNKRITNEGVKQGLQKGLKDSAGKVAKEGAKKAAKQIGKKAVETGAKTAVKAGTQVAAKGAGQAATAGLDAVVDVAAGLTGFETFGLGFLIGLLLNIAISLGVSDAVDATFEIAHGNARRAYFLVNRAAAKVGMFIYLLIMLVCFTTVVGWILAVPMLFIANVYLIAGKIAKGSGALQGIVWWETVIIVFIDFFAFIIIIVFFFSIGWYLCSTSGLGSGGATGLVANAVVSVYDWWNRTSAGSTAASFCQFVNITAGSAIQ